MIRRKYEGWRLPEFPRHEWEHENKIVVIGIGKVSETEKQLISTCIRKLLEQFGWPHEVEIAPSGSSLTRLMQEVLRSSLSQDQLNTDFVLNELNRKRRENISLHPAIVI